ncbi:MAG: uracil-DNA glycosylase [Oligoflexia bacterium]|nr:uracil-DNA glycosylase [Oligoflexia bacterium]
MKENFAYLKEVLGVRYFAIGENIAPAKSDSDLFVANGLPPDEPINEIHKKRKSHSEHVLPVSNLNNLLSDLKDCGRCKLSEGRLNIVFGYGSPKAQLMFIGEGPGEEEDAQGEPFVGKAGQLLNKMISAMGLTREEVYIANVVKCRPPENRNPELDEVEACSPYMHSQISLIKPKIIVALGAFAAQVLLGTNEKISQLRGRIFEIDGLRIIPTFHPAYLLHDPTQKKSVWQDLQLAMHELGLNIPKH